MEQESRKEKANALIHYFTCLCRSVVDIDAKIFASNAPVPRDKIPYHLILWLDWSIGYEPSIFSVNLLYL